MFTAVHQLFSEIGCNQNLPTTLEANSNSSSTYLSLEMYDTVPKHLKHMCGNSINHSTVRGASRIVLSLSSKLINLPHRKEIIAKRKTIVAAGRLSEYSLDSAIIAIEN